MNKLLEMRLKRKLTVRELAGKTGISPTTISRLENEQIKSHPITIAKLADGLGVELEELEELITDPKQNAHKALEAVGV